VRIAAVRRLVVGVHYVEAVRVVGRLVAVDLDHRHDLLAVGHGEQTLVHAARRVAHQHVRRRDARAPSSRSRSALFSETTIAVYGPGIRLGKASTRSREGRATLATATAVTHVGEGDGSTTLSFEVPPLASKDATEFRAWTGSCASSITNIYLGARRR